MTDLPHNIAFNTEEIQQILRGQKTQTRRHIAQSIIEVYRLGHAYNENALWQQIWDRDAIGYKDSRRKRSGTYLDALIFHTLQQKEMPALVWCSYGMPGSYLYVREHFKYTSMDLAEQTYILTYRDNTRAKHKIPPTENIGHLSYKIEKGQWHLPIHMKPQQSRILLKISHITYERLQDITAKGVAAEGYESHSAFKAHWDNVHTTHRWADNPYVWVVEFSLYKTKPLT